MLQAFIQSSCTLVLEFILIQKEPGSYTPQCKGSGKISEKLRSVGLCIPPKWLGDDGIWDEVHAGDSKLVAAQIQHLAGIIRVPIIYSRL